MSAANFSLVQGLYAAFGRGDIDHIVSAMSPDVTWDVNGRAQDYPTLGKRKGREAVRAFFKLVADNQQATDFSPREFHAAGGVVFVFGHYAWTLKKTGKKAAADWLHAFWIKDGKVTNFREFTDTATFAAAYRK